MAAIISIAVGAAGAFVGSAIAGTIFTSGATLFGIAATTIGGVIGAGIAGGLLNMARGGEFGKGFLTAAVGTAMGYAAGHFFGGATGAAEGVGGATQLADGTTQAAMLESQGGLEFAQNALSGDMATGVAEAGLAGAGGEIAATAANAPVTQISPMGSGEVATTIGQPLEQTLTQAGSSATVPSVYESGQGSIFGQESILPNWADYNVPGLEQIVSGGSASAPASFSEPVFSGGGTVIPPDGTTTAAMLESQGGADFAPNALEGGDASKWSLGNMIKSSDAWLEKNLGAPKGSTAKLALGGIDAMMKNYQTNKMEREANNMAPLSFEQFKQQYYTPDKWKLAANQLARSGHTGTLPTLLARMNQEAQGKYASYLPEEQRQNYLRRQGILNMRQANMSAAIRPLSELTFG